MKFYNRVSIAALGLLAAVAVPAVAGLWPDFPQVGGASYCASFSTGPTGQTCNVTVPAGPIAVTGAEVVPTETNLASGRAPQNVVTPLPLLASGALAQVTPLTGASVLIPNKITNYLITPAGTIATLTVTMPAAPINGQVVRISSSATVTALTLSGSAGQTISNAPTAITLSTTGAYGYEFVYVRLTATTGTWYRLQ